MAAMLISSVSVAQTRKIVSPVSPKAQSLMKSKDFRPSRLSGMTKDAVVINTFPYVNNFDNGSLGGWKSVDSDNDGKSWSSIFLFNEGEGNNGSAGFVSSASYDNETGSVLTPDNWLISPAIQVPSGVGMNLSWYVAAQDPSYPADHYSVYISTDSLVTSFTNAVYSETIQSADYIKHSVSLAAYAGQTIFVAFRHHDCSDEFVMKIDDISIAQPGAPEISINVPSYAFVGDTVALVSYLADGDLNGLTYEWTIAGANVTTSASESLNVIWSNEGTYTVRLVATNGFGADTAMATINILDCSTISTFPYQEGFENGLGCWVSVDADGDRNVWYAANTEAAHSGNGVAVSESYSNETFESLRPDNWLIGPAIQIPADQNLELSWYVKPSNIEFAEDHYGVFVSTTGNSVSDFTDSIWVETLDATMTDFVHRVVSFDSYAGQTIYLAFRHYASYDQLSLQIDDIKIGNMGAPEVSISGPSFARNIDQVTFVSHVVASSPITSYQWIIEGATPSSANTESVEVNFPAAGDYQVMLVASNAFGSDTALSQIHVIECSGLLVAPFAEGFEDGLGCWGNLDLDGDGYAYEQLSNRLNAIGYGELISDYVHGGADAVVSWSYFPFGVSAFGVDGQPLTAQDVLVSPAIELGEGQWKLGFDAMSFGGSEYPDDVEVRLATSNPASAEDFEAVLLPQTAVRGDDFVQYIVDLSAYAEQTIYLGFFHQSTDMFGLVLDDITIDHDIVGITSVDESSVRLYPNPTSGRFFVEAEGVISVEVLDLNGRVAMRSVGESSIDMTSLSNGVYVVRVLSDNGVSIHKIVKK